MAEFPLLKILFALAIIFNHGGHSITLTPPSSPVAVTWTLQPDGQWWHAVDAAGKDLGDWAWTEEGDTVTVRTGSSTKVQKLVNFGWQKEAGLASIGTQEFDVDLTVAGKCVLMPRTTDGIFKGPFTIQYGKHR